MARKFVKATAVAAASALTAAARSAEQGQAQATIAKVTSKDKEARAEGLRDAGRIGAPGVKPLAAAIADADFEVGRAAKRALWMIVRYAGRPGADRERQAVVAALLPLVGGEGPVNTKREVIWMVSELAGDEAVEPVAGLLANADLREDARMVLQRLPGEKSLAALKAGLAAAPEEFKPNIAASLRARGVETPGIKNLRRVPNRETTVKPLA
jgi:hypothetical protein